MKRSQKVFKPGLVGLTLLSIIGAAAFLVSNNANAGSQNTPTGIAGYHAAEIYGDIPVELRNVSVRTNDVQAELCIKMPTLDPWNPYATLTVDGTVVPNSEVALLDAKNPKVMETSKRCYLFTFPLSADGSISGKGVLKLDKLWLELGRGQMTDEVIAEVKTRLNSVSPGVDFEVVTIAGKDGGGVSINITSKPENMSDDDVVSLIQQLSIDVVPTDWETEINLK